jgi:hypothetical protein
LHYHPGVVLFEYLQKKPEPFPKRNNRDTILGLGASLLCLASHINQFGFVNLNPDEWALKTKSDNIVATLGIFLHLPTIFSPFLLFSCLLLCEEFLKSRILDPGHVFSKKYTYANFQYVWTFVFLFLFTQFYNGIHLGLCYFPVFY